MARMLVQTLLRLEWPLNPGGGPGLPCLISGRAEGALCSSAPWRHLRAMAGGLKHRLAPGKK